MRRATAGIAIVAALAALASPPRSARAQAGAEVTAPQRFDGTCSVPGRATALLLSDERIVVDEEVLEPGAPTADGAFEAVWKHVPLYPLESSLSGELAYAYSACALDRDLTSGFQAIVRHGHLHIYVRVLDDDVVEGDRILLSLEAEISEGSRVTFEAGPQGIVQTSGAELAFRAARGDAPPAALEGGEALTGYAAELSIPLTDIGLAPIHGASVGLAVRVVDVDPESAAPTEWLWADGIVPAGSDAPPMGRLTLASHLVAGSAEGFLPRQVWREEDGVVVVEAEAIDRHSNWVLERSAEGHTGEGYLAWRGPHRSVSPPPFVTNHTRETVHENLGPQREWLIVRVAISRAGLYRVDLRNLHFREDGDNDVWIGRVGQRFGPEAPILRMGDNHRDGRGFTWLDWGVHGIELEAGVHDVFVGGRSRNFGIDRIAVYRDGDDQAKARALDPATPPSPFRIDEDR